MTSIWPQSRNLHNYLLRLVLFSYLLCDSPLSWAQSFPQKAEPFLSVWLDPTGRTAFSELKTENFRSAESESLNYGYTKSVAWLKLEISNPNEYAVQRFFEIELDTISLFEFYRLGDEQPIQTGGQKRAWNPKSKHRHPVLTMNLPAQTQETYYLRLENNYSLSIIAWIHSYESLAAKESRESMIFGAFVGLILFALLLSLFMFVSTAHDSFLIFAFMLLIFHLGFHLTNFGLSMIYLWPNATWWGDRATFFFMELANIAGIVFLNNSLELKKNLPRVAFWLKIPLAKGLVFILWSWVSLEPSLVSLSVHLTAILLPIYFLIGIYLWYHGYSPAKYQTLAWTTVILFNLLSILQALGAMNFDNSWFRSAIRFDLVLLACSIQAIFLAISIGDQFQQVLKDREVEYFARKKLEKNLDDAHAVQEAFIREDVQSHSFEIVTSHHPSAKIGGDWLGYHYDPVRKRLLLAISDVTGHGLPSALLTGAIHGAFYGLSHNEELDSLQGSELLAMLMTRINAVVNMTAVNTSLLATMVMLAIDLQTGRIDYINAGHTPIVLIHLTGPEYILHGGSPLGLGQTPKFGVGHYLGQPGDTLFLYTDGLLENAKSPRRLQLHHLSQLLNPQDSLVTLQGRLEELVGPDAASMEDDYSYIICRLLSA